MPSEDDKRQLSLDLAAGLTDTNILSLLAHIEEQVNGKGWDQLPMLIAIVDPLTLESLDLKTRHSSGDGSERAVLGAVLISTLENEIYQSFVGQKAPLWALGIVHIGEAWLYPEHVDREVAAYTTPTDYEDRRELRKVTALLRDGRIYSLERIRGDELEPVHELTATLLTDCLHRMLDLPTGGVLPPIGATLARSLAFAVADLLENNDFTEVKENEEGLRLGRVLIRTDQSSPWSIGFELGWEHQQGIDVGARWYDVDPWEMAWMDTAMLARVVHKRYPPLEESMVVIRAVTGDEGAGAVQRHLDRLGWLAD